MGISVKHLGMVTAVVTLITATTSLAGAASTGEQLCQSKRLAAWSKYESCVAKTMGKIFAGAPLDAVAQGALAKCRTKYAANWDKLSGIEGSTTCVGSRFVDNDNGSIFDKLSGLSWSKQGDNGAEPFDKDSIYDWSTGGDYSADGTAFDSLLATTNGSTINGHQDWRMPTIAELLSIVLPGELPCASSPCIDPVFHTSCTAGCGFYSACSCTTPYTYWTDVTVPESSNMAYIVHFGTGELATGFKTLERDARFVRGGLH